MGDGPPRGDASETPLGRVAVPKTGQKNALPREDASETPLGKVAVPKTDLPGWDGAGIARGCLIFTARGFFIGQMLVANDFISIFVD